MTRILSLICIFCTSCIFAQSVEEKIFQSYYSPSDKIMYKYSNWPEMLELDLTEGDTVSPGTDTYPGITMTAYIGNDTLVIKGDNYPFYRKSFVTIHTPEKKTTAIFRFNASPSNFSDTYIAAHVKKSSFEIPEVFELANIIWALSPAGKTATDLQTNTAYYKDVVAHFTPYLDHPVFRKLTFPGISRKDYYTKYYDFRENSFIYEYGPGQRIVKGQNYNYVYGEDGIVFSNLFTELLPLVQDFADKSGFRTFYKDHLPFYTADLERTKSAAARKPDVGMAGKGVSRQIAFVQNCDLTDYIRFTQHPEIFRAAIN